MYDRVSENSAVTDEIIPVSVDCGVISEINCDDSVTPIGIASAELLGGTSV